MFTAKYVKTKLLDSIDINDITEYKKQYQNLKENLKESISKKSINDNFLEIIKQCQDLRLDIFTFQSCLATKRLKNIIKKNLDNKTLPTRNDIDLMNNTSDINADLKILKNETPIITTTTIDNYLEQVINMFTEIEIIIEDTEIIIEQIKLQI